MKDNPPPPDFSFSQKIYGRLLLAYPRPHRAKYGVAMAQLFRDQCRGAWSESRNWGLLKLWLRVLPDLASTSILERLAALNERKSMNDKLANLFGFHTTPAMTFFRVFTVIFLLVFLTSAVITFVLPESYASTARMKVEPDASAGPSQPPVYDPYFLQTTFEIIQSKIILEPVIQKLNLNEKWGKKYNGGLELKTADTLQLLKRRLDLEPVRNTELIHVTVYNEDRDEAAQIANAITESYRDYRDKIEARKPDTQIPNNSMVTIIDTAKPGMRPVRPNRPLNIALGTMIGTLLGLGVGATAAGIGSLISRRSHGNGSVGMPNIPPAATASRSANEGYRLGPVQRIAGLLWMVISGILCGLALLALFWVLVHGPKLSESIFIQLFAIFWAANAVAGFFLFRGRSWAKTCVTAMTAVCWTSGLMMVWSTSPWFPPVSNSAVRLLVLQAWRLFAMIFPLPRALQWPFMVFALVTTCALLWRRRKSFSGSLPAT
jgi:capsular polysaccharide biosynthesis protein